MDRRTLISGTALVGVSLASRRAFGQVGERIEDVTYKTYWPEIVIDEVKKLYDFAGTYWPAFDKISTVFKFIGFISDLQFQEQLFGRLDAIDKSLSVINAKLDEIIRLIRALPDVVARELDDFARRDLKLKVYARYKRFNQIVRSAGGAPERLAPQERASLRSGTFEPLADLVEQLKLWGPVGYVPVCFGFSTLASMAKWCDVPAGQVRVMRSEAVAYLLKSGHTFKLMAENAAKREAEIRRIVIENTARPVFIAATTGSVYIGTPAYVHYAVLKGGYDSGLHWNGSRLDREIDTAETRARLNLLYDSSYLSDDPGHNIRDRFKVMFDKLNLDIKEAKNGSLQGVQYRGHAAACFELARQAEGITIS